MVQKTRVRVPVTDLLHCSVCLIGRSARALQWIMNLSSSLLPSLPHPAPRKRKSNGCCIQLALRSIKTSRPSSVPLSSASLLLVFRDSCVVSSCCTNCFKKKKKGRGKNKEKGCVYIFFLKLHSSSFCVFGGGFSPFCCCCCCYRPEMTLCG